MIREIARLLDAGLSQRKIAETLGISRNTVSKYVKDKGSALSPAVYSAPWAGDLDWEAIRRSTSDGTLQEYWESNCQQLTSYSSFWREYRRRFPDLPLEMHKVHKPGERGEIDYKGDAEGLGFFDRACNQYKKCKLFGFVSCYSQYFFAFATEDEKRSSWLTATSEALNFIGGAPKTLVSDNAKALVDKAHIYDPDVNKEFSFFCNHFGTVPIIARPRKPKDKNLVEQNLGTFWRWCRKRVQARTFYSLAEINAFLKILVEEYNLRKMRKYQASRSERFQLEKEKLLNLPNARYSYSEWKIAKVHPDCHIQVNRNFYSVPYQYRTQQVDVRVSRNLIEIFSELDLISSHFRLGNSTKGQYSTIKTHLPESHNAIKESTPEYLKKQAEAIGTATCLVVSHLLDDAAHPYQFLRRVQGIIRLKKRYSAEALERACAEIVEIGKFDPKIRDIDELIKTHLIKEKSKPKPVKRNANNPFLRGQNHWGQP